MLSSGGQRLLLELVELSLGDGAAVKQALRRRDLICGTAALTGNRLDVLVRRDLSFLHLSRLPLSHSTTASDQIDNGCEEGENDQEDDPERLPPTAQFPVPEQIGDDLEQHHQIHYEEKGPNEEPEEVPETVHYANLPLESKRGWGASAATHSRACALLHLGVQRFAS
jgi:hypothetical protein